MYRPSNPDKNNLFAASGHRNYAKCSRLYLQEMRSLSDTNPWPNKQFEDGYHAVRCSNRFWAGLWSDFIIEQTLMQSIKCTGGLTRGRSFEENFRNLCVVSISYGTAVHESIWSNFWVLVLVQGIKILILEWKGTIVTVIIANNFSAGSKLEIHLIWKMATFILYQQVLSQYMIKTQWIVIKWNCWYSGSGEYWWFKIH